VGEDHDSVPGASSVFMHYMMKYIAQDPASLPIMTTIDLKT
jgi:hypothetical protein